MNRCALFLSLVLLPSAVATAQSSSLAFNPIPADPFLGAAAGSGGKGASVEVAPFSRIALGAGISPLGVNLQIVTNASRHFNIRGTGNYFDYTVNNISTNGFSASAKLNLASAGASLDYYPFPNHGFRLSPGVLFYNTNSLGGSVIVAGGQTFTLDGNTFTSSSTNPVTGAFSLGLHSQNPAFTITTGWGNQISRKGGHLSFPVEVGVAVTGTPGVNLALVSGQVCDSEGDCQNVATDAQVQSALQAQVAKYEHDLNPLRVYPILSFGVSYNFKIR